MNSSRATKLFSLEGKVALISGGASGIGLGTAKLLGEMGAKIAIFDIDEKKGKEAVSEIENLGTEAIFIRCDVASASDCKEGVEETVRRFGKIDILVNNAGIIIRKDVVDLSEEEWDRAIDITLKGVYLLSHYVIPHMVRNGGGSIINIGSGWSLKGGPKAASYCAAKGGVLNLTRAMAIDHGQDNIRVNCVCPGDVDTPLLRGECAQLGEDLDKFMKEAGERPINRVGTPEDIAKAVLFLASDMSSWITGSFLVVDGGGLA